MDAQTQTTTQNKKPQLSINTTIVGSRKSLEDFCFLNDPIMARIACKWKIRLFAKHPNVTDRTKRRKKVSSKFLTVKLYRKFAKN